MSLKLEVVQHETGERIPLILDSEGFPLSAPNEWLLSRRELSQNTLIRNARELIIFVQWLSDGKIGLEERIRSERFFTEAEIKGGLIERLRHSVKASSKATVHASQKLVRIHAKSELVPVGDETFNQRLATIRAFLAWSFDTEIGRLSSTDIMFKRVEQHKKHVERIIDSAFIAQAVPVSSMRKALTEVDLKFFKSIVHYKHPQALGENESVKFRNYICAMIMLLYGLRMGELLSLRVQDVVVGRISELRVVRRPADPEDVRRPVPRVKRLARQLALDSDAFVKQLTYYIDVHRERMMDVGDARDHDYLIVSDEGDPLHLNTLSEFFRRLRMKFPEQLPKNLTSKMLRHTFSSQVEKRLRDQGYEEDHRRQVLADLRGDNTLKAQDTYIRAGLVDAANDIMRAYHTELVPDSLI